jgi:glycosyltransferase involved in cell wall biosynthesis
MRWKWDDVLMRFSIITPSFNSAATIRETIESVLKQNYPDVEHIVVDGGSKDGTLEILGQYPHLQWTSEKDEGHYHAMNKGIQRCTGDVVAILNADDCYREGALQRIAAALQSHPEWDGLFTDVVYVDKDGEVIFKRKEAVFDYDVLRYGSVFYVIHPTLFLKKSVYDRLGGYKHREFLNCCDVELILRLGRSGCRIGHVPEFLVNYRFHEHGQSADLRVMRNMAAESQRIRRDHGCPPGILGKAFGLYARAKRQAQKLLLRGTCDLVPGRWFLRRHMRRKTAFSSNIGIDRLEGDR